MNCDREMCHRSQNTMMLPRSQGVGEVLGSGHAHQPPDPHGDVAVLVEKSRKTQR